MGLFSFNKNKEAITPVKGSLKNIKVLGAGCSTCHKQYEYAQAACKELGLNIEVEYITDLEKIMEYGMMSMPLIVIRAWLFMSLPICLKLTRRTLNGRNLQ